MSRAGGRSLHGARPVARSDEGVELARDPQAAVLGPLAWRMITVTFEPNAASAWPRLVEVLCGRLRASDLQMAELAMQRLPVRLAKVLLRMAHSESLGRPADKVEVSQCERISDRMRAAGSSIAIRRPLNSIDMV
jgi:hypothetical protein